MDHHYYGRQNRTWPKKLPRSLLEQTPEDVVTAKKHRMAKTPIVATPQAVGFIIDPGTGIGGGGFV